MIPEIKLGRIEAKLDMPLAERVFLATGQLFSLAIAQAAESGNPESGSLVGMALYFFFIAYAFESSFKE